MKLARVPELIAELKTELESLRRIKNSIQATVKNVPAVDRENVFTESLALKLHNFYTGCERVFAFIAGDLNGELPSNAAWHSRLLHAMTLEVEGVRPSVVSKATARRLHEFLLFRHVVRNVYGFDLDLGRMEYLIKNVDAAYSAFEADVKEFTCFLESLMKEGD